MYLEKRSTLLVINLKMNETPKVIRKSSKKLLYWIIVIQCVLRNVYVAHDLHAVAEKKLKSYN